MAKSSAVADNEKFGRPTRRKRVAGLIAMVGSMAIWNPVENFLGELAQSALGEVVYKTASLVFIVGQLVWSYRRDLADEFLAEVGSTVSESPYRLERIQRSNQPDSRTSLGLALRTAVPDLLSLSRPAIGLWAAAFLWNGNVAEAAIVYSVGILTDVLDGWLARRLTGGTSWGKDLDGITDSVMNILVFGAVAGVGVRDGERWFVIAAILLLILWIVTRLFTSKHSVAAKFRSGITRSVLYVAIVATLPSPGSWIGLAAGAVMLLVGGRYEWGVTMRERESGARPDWGEGWVQQRLKNRGQEG